MGYSNDLLLAPSDELAEKVLTEVMEVANLVLTNKMSYKETVFFLN